MNIIVATNMQYGILLQNQPMHCPLGRQVMQKICDLSHHAEHLFSINDRHEGMDIEFKYLPEHFLYNSIYSVRVDEYEKQFKSKHIHRLFKNTLDPLRNGYINSVVCRLIEEQNPTIVVSGFVGSLDVLATCFSLIAYSSKIVIIEECFGDLSEEKKKHTLETLAFLGIKIYPTIESFLQK